MGRLVPPRLVARNEVTACVHGERAQEMQERGEAMTRRGWLVLGLSAALVMSSCAVAGPALDILEDLARSARSERLISGYTLVGVGAAIAVVSAAVLMDSGMGVYGIVAGGLVAVPGLVTLAFPSRAERELSSAGGSETAAALALEQMAAEGRFERILSGVFNVAAGTASLLFPYRYFTPYDYLYSAISSFGLAAYDFLFLSREERAYRQYETLLDGGV